MNNQSATDPSGADLSAASPGAAHQGAAGSVAATSRAATLHATEIDRFILDSAREANILPLTSRCDSHCVFCSHRNNPPGITVVSIGVRSLEDIARTLAFLDPGRVITIGESATPIIEGEPFTHPRFREVIALVRRAFLDTPVEITTNGRFLAGDMVTFLEDAGKIFLNVSLNSASAWGRKLLMGDTWEESERALAGVGLLAASTVRFAGSLVAMPNLVGWDDVRRTVVFLAESGAVAVRVIMPAFSSWAKQELFPNPDTIYAELREFVHSLSPELPCPVLIEPSRVTDLTPVVSGVLKDSPAWSAGIRRDDVLVTINGETPRCRVEAWNMLLPEGKVTAETRRDGGQAGRGETGPGGDTTIVCWTNVAEGDSGITMEYDFDPVRAENVREAVLSGPGRSVLLASELGHQVVRLALGMMDIRAERAELVLVPNRTFGGTIRAAGLLTVDDYLEGYAAWRAGVGEIGAAPAQLLVPVESFDSRGFDLKRVHFSELEKRTGVPVLLR